MKRVAFRMQLHPGQGAEYQRRHDELWPELAQLLRETGVHDYSIFLDSTDGSLFGVLTIDEPLKLDELPAHPVMQRWWKYMSDIMKTNPDHSPQSFALKEVFYLP